MGKTASIDFLLGYRNTDIVTTINNLIKAGWSLSNGFDNITYLPLNDKDDYNWTSMPLEDSNDFFEVAQKKEREKEVVGVIMTIKGTIIGGEFLFFNKENLSININFNRKKLEFCEVTDINWYLEKIYPILDKIELGIEEVHFKESAI